MSLAIANPDLDKLIEIFENVTKSRALLILQGDILEWQEAEKLSEGAIYGIALILGIATPNPDRTLTNAQWNTCIDYIHTRNQVTEAA
jgi:hypothetical protein